MTCCGWGCTLLPGFRSLGQASPPWSYCFFFFYSSLLWKWDIVHSPPLRGGSHPPDTWQDMYDFEILPCKRLNCSPYFFWFIYRSIDLEVFILVYALGCNFSSTLSIMLHKLFHQVPFGCWITNILSLHCSVGLVLSLLYLWAAVHVEHLYMSFRSAPRCPSSMSYAYFVRFIPKCLLFITIIQDNVALISNSSCSLLIGEGN